MLQNDDVTRPAAFCNVKLLKFHWRRRRKVY
jgi:hypothetical protein